MNARNIVLATVVLVQLSGLIAGVVMCIYRGRKEGDWLAGFLLAAGVGMLGYPVLLLVEAIWK